MSDLSNYVSAHAERGECRCGRCVGAGDPENQPKGHTADMHFFNVAAVDADADELRRLAIEHDDVFGDGVDVFDGKEHGYIELGGWLGDQTVALMFMGIGSILGLFTLMTPKMLPGIPSELADQMAGAGMVTIQAKVSVDES